MYKNKFINQEIKVFYPHLIHIMKKFYLIILIIGIFSHLSLSQSVLINEFMSSNDTTIDDSQGESSDWIELYNTSASAFDLSGYFMSDDSLELTKWQFPSGTIPANGFLLIWASGEDSVFAGNEIHCSFKISSAGEPLFLTAPDSITQIDQVDSVSLSTDLSYIRQPDGSANWMITAEPSPGSSNNSAIAYQGLLAPVEFSHPAGFYTDSFYLSIANLMPGDTVYYTLDGSEPTKNSPVFTDSIVMKSRLGDPNNLSLIQTTTDQGLVFDYWEPPNGEVLKINVIKAKVIKENYLSEATSTATYFVDNDGINRYTLPVVSLSIDSSFLFDDTIGIYVPGAGFDGYDWQTCNFAQHGSDWERRGHLEFFDDNGERVINQDMGVRIAGAASRTLNVKSLRFYARTEYGENKINYQIFPTKDQDEFKRMTFRTSGNDCHYTYLRDAFHHFMFKDMTKLSLMQYRPVIMFINGEYWGIHNIRERYDDNYLEENYGVAEDSIDFLEKNSEVIVGDDIHYEMMLDSLTTLDMSDSANYAYMTTLVDMENLAEYIAANLIICNTDWPFNNIRFWRKRVPYTPGAQYGHDGRWRWLTYDTDYGFGRVQQAHYDQINQVLSNSGYSTKIIRYLMGNSSLPGNEQFRHLVFNKVCDELNTTFMPTHSLASIDSFANRIEPEILEHIGRWRKPSNYTFWKTIQIENKMKTFGQDRPDYLRQHFLNHFNISGISNLTVDVSDTLHGKVQVNSKMIEIETRGIYGQVYPWTGQYFEGVSLQLQAIAETGFMFSHWSDGNTDIIREISISSDSAFIAYFNIDTTFTPPPDYSGLVINEILATNITDIADNAGDHEDWIELYNNSTDTLQIGGLYFTDDLSDPDKWQVPSSQPDSTIIAPGEFIVFYADEEPEEGVLHLDFKLSSNGESIGIFQDDGINLISIDSISYGPQLDDVSYGRFVDGESNWYSMTITTPGMPNDTSSSQVPVVIPDLYINEFLADNDSNIVDNYGEYEDWIEIYNAGTSPVDIGGLYMSDTGTDPTMFLIPDDYPDSTTIAPGGFLYLWADNDEEQGVLHLGFKLGAGGEQIVLSKQANGTVYIIDSLSYGEQYSDTTYGRYPDGSNIWHYMAYTTPGAPNMTDSMAVAPVDICINEFLASNSQGLTDNYGEYEDWIEIYNRGADPVDIGGFYISDDLSNPGLYQIPDTWPDSTTIAPGDFLVLFADNDEEQGILHLGLKLGVGGESILISSEANSQFTIYDSLSFAAQTADISYGRYPDGGPAWHFMEINTPGAANTIDSLPIQQAVLFINEFMASNTQGITDNFGEYEDWIEIYNSSSSPVDIGGYYLSDINSFPTLWQIPDTWPDSTTIAPGGYLVLWADNDEEQGILHLGFKLSATGETILLSEDNNGSANVIDSISYVNQTANISYGRYPDGSPDWHAMPITTPGSSNMLNYLPDYNDLYINEFLANNNNLHLDEFGDDDDWIEIYNDGPVPIDIGGLYMTDVLSNPLLHQIPDTDPSATTIAPGDFILLWADNETNQGVLHLGFKLGTSGEQIGLIELVDTIPEILDSLSFGPQTSNISYGRYPDGSATFFNFENTTPGAPNYLGLPPFQDYADLVINEYMATNDSTIADNFGNFEDWIEIYNPTSQAIDLGGLYLTDNLSEPDQYQIPDSDPDSTTIQANDFMLFWADSDSEKGIHHLNFKLSQSGEELGLFYINQSDTLPIDTLSYTEQSPDTSNGRFTDGANDWYFMSIPTPGNSNILFILSDNQTISMPHNWSIISSYINPDVLDLPGIFQPIINDVIIVKNGAGLVYWPQYGINAIGNWNFEHGYQVKVDGQQDLTIAGTSIVPETSPLILPAGWNMIAYLRQTPYSIVSIFSPIITDVIIAKDGDGMIYWPQYGINMINNMIPGKGYMVRLTNGSTLTYPAN